MTNITPRPTLLVLNPFAIYPAISGGQSRVFNLFKYLTPYYEVIVVCLADRRENKEIAPGMRQILVPKSLKHRQAEWEYYQTIGFFACAVTPLLVHHTPELSYVLQQYFKKAHITILSHPYLFDEVHRIGTVRNLVYDAHNVEWLLASYLLPATMSEIINEAYRVEQLACTNSILITTCSTQDAAVLDSLYKMGLDKCYQVPNGADVAAIPFTSRSQCRQNKAVQGITQPVAIFIGSNHLPNIEAGHEIITLATKLPDIRFWFIGSQCHYFKKHTIPNNIELKGIVSEAEKNKLLQMADIALNPIVSGSGTNIKMLEYMAAGVPIITTEFGARGIHGIPGKHFSVGELSNLAKAIPELVNNVQMSDYMGKQALALVNAQYDWKVIANNLVKVLNKVTT